MTNKEIFYKLSKLNIPQVVDYCYSVNKRNCEKAKDTCCCVGCCVWIGKFFPTVKNVSNKEWQEMLLKYEKILEEK